MDDKKAKKIKYNVEYNKKHYRTYGFNADLYLAEQIDKFCDFNELTKTEFLKKAVKFFLKNYDPDKDEDDDNFVR